VKRLSGLCDGIKVSLESASERVQNEVLEKRLDPASVETVAGWCRKQGLPLGIHYLIGIPGEKRGEIRDTIETAVRLHREYGARPLLQFAAPLPGTRLHRICVEQGLVGDSDRDRSEAFQRRGVITTAEFDPDLLQRARDLLDGEVAAGTSRKVIVNLTYHCNNHCVFCAVGDRPRGHADLEAVTGALRRYRDEGFELLDIDGGEPTLHPGLLTVIERARRIGYSRVALITNGRRAGYAAFARQLARSGLYEILVSLHAPDAGTQERLTGVPEAFEQTTGGIRNLLEAMPSPHLVAVNTTLVCENLPRVRALERFLSDLGVRRWNLQVVTPFGRAHAGLVPTEADLRRHLGELLDDPRSEMRVKVINCPPCLLPGHERAASVDFGKAERDMVFVGAAGENLQGYLSVKRRRTARCRSCIYALVCPGEYDFGSPPP
jgi:MoaA/NifB/PqqE/SkfB family radical SAM enzyme